MHYVTAKGILSAQNGMNLYRGCTHGCIYCDSRSQCYQMDHAFEDVAVKQNAIELLEQELRRRRKPCMIGTGSMSDPYQPVEEQLGYMRQALELIARYGFGVTILTKSSRILRDLDLLRRIHAQTRCVVQMTLTTYDETLCRKLEPHVSTTRERVETLRILRDAGIPTVVWISPILPFLNDTAENLDGLLQYCIQSGVTGIVNFGMGMTLRDGCREYFYTQLDQMFPGLRQRYVRMYGNRYVLNSPNHDQLAAKLKRVCTQNGILCTPEEVFAELNRFECRQAGEQLSLFM
ncbi:MAG: SPL family radical SAM protein [Butyricicoccus sp.]